MVWFVYTQMIILGHFFVSFKNSKTIDGGFWTKINISGFRVWIKKIDRFCDSVNNFDVIPIIIFVILYYFYKKPN